MGCIRFFLTIYMVETLLSTTPHTHTGFLYRPGWLWTLRSACLSLPSTGIKDVRCHARLHYHFLLGSYLTFWFVDLLRAVPQQHHFWSPSLHNAVLPRTVYAPLWEAKATHQPEGILKHNWSHITLDAASLVLIFPLRVSHHLLSMGYCHGVLSNCSKS